MPMKKNIVVQSTSRIIRGRSGRTQTISNVAPVMAPTLGGRSNSSPAKKRNSVTRPTMLALRSSGTSPMRAPASSRATSAGESCLLAPASSRRLSQADRPTRASRDTNTTGAASTAYSKKAQPQVQPDDGAGRVADDR